MNIINNLWSNKQQDRTTMHHRAVMLGTVSSTKIYQTRADQNTGGALLKFPMRTAMHGKSRVSFAISATINKISNLVSQQWQ